jgi:cytochrome c oxidase assembly protein subunit 15
MGFTDLSFRITKDPSVLEEEPFNATKTWIEYLNRVLGVLIGFFIFLAFLFSLVYRKTDKKIVGLSFAAFIAVGIEGFIGSIVVSTNLLPALITIHMLLAIAIVLLLIYALARTKNSTHTDKITHALPTSTENLMLEKLLIFSIITSVIQITLGTQIRETIDTFAHTIQRNLWIDNLGISFYIHRSFSLAILALHLYLVYKLFSNSTKLQKWSYILLGFVAVEIITGTIMAYFAIPAMLQPIHLTLATVIVGVQFWIYLQIPKTREIMQSV